MTEKRFWIYNMIGSIIWASSIILLGIFFIDQYEAILDHLGKIMLGILIVVIAYIYFFRREKFGTYMREKQQEIEERVRADEQKRALKKSQKKLNI